MKRSSGILMPVSSLPSKYGIGSLGREAYNFIDFLARAGQSWWQILPVGPVGFGNSPYQSVSTFAGNPYYIDLDRLVADGLLLQEEVDAAYWGDDPGRTDYGALYLARLPLLEKAAERGLARKNEAFDSFVAANAWLEDYALFMAIKAHFGGASWFDWPDGALRHRDPKAISRFREEHAEDMQRTMYIQYLFFMQWNELRAYVRERGVGIIGDLPIYAAPDSADVWSEPENFQLDKDLVPKEVAGVPPDYFTADGQLWGNPLYDYDFMEKDGFGWWIRRLKGAGRLYDVIRIDHFRGLESYWAVPYGETTAKNGRWRKGPGMELVKVMKEAFADLSFIAEDLGYPSPEVRQLLAESGFPGMKVLEFAFDHRDAVVDYLPHRYRRNCVCYTGTHDNDTLAGWLGAADRKDLDMAVRYLGLNKEEGYIRGILRGGMSSVANVFMAQMQDYLELGSDARMNIPGTAEGNWQWRMLPGALTAELAEEIRKMTELYGRSN